MTQELIDLKASILEGRYDNALLIIDELEGMSKQFCVRAIARIANCRLQILN